MSSPERIKSQRGLGVALLMAAAISLAGCQVQPLYGSGPAAADGTTAGVSDELAAIDIKPVTSRYAQEVRNRLTFLFTGGGARTVSPLYSLDLGVTVLTESAAAVQVATEDEPTAGTLTLISNYVLTDAATSERIGSGKRQITASYDIPRQEFAAQRAVRDAENRAARELAELLRLAIAQDLSRR